MAEPCSCHTCTAPQYGHRAALAMMCSLPQGVTDLGLPVISVARCGKALHVLAQRVALCMLRDALQSTLVCTHPGGRSRECCSARGVCPAAQAPCSLRLVHCTGQAPTHSGLRVHALIKCSGLSHCMPCMACDIQHWAENHPTSSAGQRLCSMQRIAAQHACSDSISGHGRGIASPGDRACPTCTAGDTPAPVGPAALLLRWTLRRPLQADSGSGPPCGAYKTDPPPFRATDAECAAHVCRSALHMRLTCIPAQGG